jgi:hypothetical protein
MSEHHVEAGMSREQILEEVLAAERDTRDLLARAALVTDDAEERRLYARLAGREEQSLRELTAEEDRLDAEAFVQRALDV